MKKVSTLLLEVVCDLAMRALLDLNQQKTEWNRKRKNKGYMCTSFAFVLRIFVYTHVLLTQAIVMDLILYIYKITKE